MQPSPGAEGLPSRAPAGSARVEATDTVTRSTSLVSLEASKPSEDVAAAAALPSLTSEESSAISKASRSLLPADSQLPPGLRHYLEQYPQPAFVLRASVLHEVLVDRPARLAAQSGNPSGSTPPGSHTSARVPGDTAPGDSSSADKASELTSRQLYEGQVTEEERRERAEDEREAALETERAAGLRQDEPSTGLTPASLPPVSSALTGGHPRAHARATRVLEEAFSRDESALVATLGLREGEQKETFTKASLLEGGSQKSHDPSRTAEGAVKSYYEQQTQHEQAKKVAAQAAAEDAARRAEITRRGGPDEDRFVWSQGEGSGSQARWRTSELACRGLEDPDAHGTPAPVPPHSPNPSTGISNLRDALTPSWHNARWAELFAEREDVATSSDEELDTSSKPIDLVSVLSRDDALELASMLIGAIEPVGERTGTALAYSAQAVLVEMKFPETSVFRHAAGFTASTAEPAAPHLEPAVEASSVDSGSVSGGAKSTAHEAQGQGPAVRSKHKGIQGVSDKSLPLLQVIATSMPDIDAVVCTTVVTNIPLPVAVSGTVKKPPEEFERERAHNRERKRKAGIREAASRLRHVEESRVPSAVAQQQRGEDVLAETVGRRSRHRAHNPSDVQRTGDSLTQAEIPPSSKQGLRKSLRPLEPSGGQRQEVKSELSDISSSRNSGQVFDLEDVSPERTPPAPTIARLFSAEGTQLEFLREDESAASKRRLGQATPARVTAGKAELLHPVRLANVEEAVESEDDDVVENKDDSAVEDNDEALARLRRASHTGSTDSLNTLHQSPSAAQGDEEVSLAAETAVPSSSATSRPPSPPMEILRPPAPQREPRLRSTVSAQGEHPFESLLSSTDCGRLLLEMKSNAAPLGDISAWSLGIRIHVQSTLADPWPNAILIDDVLLYNDAYATLIGSRHPSIFGQSGAEAVNADLPGAWQIRMAEGGSASRIFEDQCVLLMREGIQEECYLTWSHSLLRDEEGQIIGEQRRVIEMTSRVIAERRLATLRELSQATLMARSLEELSEKAATAFGQNPHDIPFTLFYSCDIVSATPGMRTVGAAAGANSSLAGTVKDTTFSSRTTDASHQRIRLDLRSTVGVPERHPSAPTKVICAMTPDSNTDAPSSVWSFTAPVSGDSGPSSTTSEETASSTVWPLVEVLHTRKPVFISDLGTRADGFGPGVWPERPTSAVVLPVLIEGTAIPKGVLIIGLNPHRPFNAPYGVFLSLLSRTISAALLGVSKYQDQSRRERELLSLGDARQAFFANVTHELRTPLQLIIGPLQDVLNSTVSALAEQDRSHLTAVLGNAFRLLRLVNTLLDQSRIESGGLDAKFRPMKIGARVRVISELFRNAIERAGLAFNVAIGEDRWTTSGPFYVADELLEGILCNLLSNALKFSLAGTITVDVNFDASQAILSVRDTGSGIDEADLDAIFERFRRAEAARHVAGTGIGLSLVLAYVEAAGSTISVKSKLGEGSTFTVRIPRGSAHVPPGLLDEDPYETMSPAPQSTQTLALIQDAELGRLELATLGVGGPGPETDHGPGRESQSDPSDLDGVVASGPFRLDRDSTVCLVVDDNAQMRGWIRTALASRWNVVEAENGQEALAYALAHPVSIVITDLAMPVMDGRSLLARLRQNPPTSSVPVIFISAEAAADARVDALSLGADDFLVKPFESRELVARTMVHLQAAQHRKELERCVNKRTEALVASEDQLKKLADQMNTLARISPVGIVQVNTAGQIIYANPRFYEISGHSAPQSDAEAIQGTETIIGDGWLERIAIQDRGKVSQMWLEAVRRWSPSGHVLKTEFQFDNGKWVQLELRPFEKGYIGAFTDISHQKEIEASHLDVVEHRAQEAEETKRATEAFMDTASHELRNPLSGIASARQAIPQMQPSNDHPSYRSQWQNAEVVHTSLERTLEWVDGLVKGHPVSEAIAVRERLLEDLDGVASIRICAEHQKRIADDIINVSKLNLGLLTIELSPYSPVDILHEVKHTFESSAKTASVTIGIDVDDSLKAFGVDKIIGDAVRIRQCVYNFVSNAIKFAAQSEEKLVRLRLSVTDAEPHLDPAVKRIAAPGQTFEPPAGCLWLIFSVEDSGRGLDQLGFDRLFARFAQANPRTDQYGGSGLGLFIVKKLVELQRGFIEVSSEPGCGAKFSFAIPAARYESRTASPATEVTPLSAPAWSPAQISSASTAATSPQSESASSYFPRMRMPSSSGEAPLATPPLAPAGPVRVLVVEDNVINQKVMTRQLKQQGFEVEVAGDGQQALDILMSDAKKGELAADGGGDRGARMFHVVLCDIEMPVMDGLTAVRELRRRERDGEISHRYPVCAVTGNAREGQRRECLEAGFDDIANKPYNLSRLLQQISQLTGLPLASPH